MKNTVTVAEMRKLISKYNNQIHIKGYWKMDRAQMTEACRKVGYVFKYSSKEGSQLVLDDAKQQQKPEDEYSLMKTKPKVVKTKPPKVVNTPVKYPVGAIVNADQPGGELYESIQKDERELKKKAQAIVARIKNKKSFDNEMRKLVLESNKPYDGYYIDSKISRDLRKKRNRLREEFQEVINSFSEEKLENEYGLTDKSYAKLVADIERDPDTNHPNIYDKPNPSARKAMSFV